MAVRYIKYTDIHGNVSYIKRIEPDAKPKVRVIKNSKSKKAKESSTKARSKRWQKSYTFSRKSPIAKRLRKLF